MISYTRHDTKLHTGTRLKVVEATGLQEWKYSWFVGLDCPYKSVCVCQTRICEQITAIIYLFVVVSSCHGSCNTLSFTWNGLLNWSMRVNSHLLYNNFAVSVYVMQISISCHNVFVDVLCCLAFYLSFFRPPTYFNNKYSSKTVVQLSTEIFFSVKM